MLAAALLFGGGTRYGVPSDSLLALISLPALGFGMFSLLRRPIPERGRLPLLLIGCATLLVLIQLLPLPPAFWTHLPGRAQFAETYATAGIPVPWMAISLDAAATVRSALSLIPALAVFLCTLPLQLGDRRALCLMVISLAFFNVLWGLAQLMEGPDSGLYFFEYTNTASAVGLFGNRNHFAALLYSTIPLVAAWAASLVYQKQLRQGLAVAMCVVVYGTLVIGLSTTLSRAGLILGFVSAAVSLAMIWPSGLARSQGTRAKLMAIAGLCIVVVSQVVLVIALGQRETLGDATRLQMAEITLRGSFDYFPIGSGFGTFVPIFGMFQGADSAFINYVNHAHDDWLELWLEGGVPAAVLLLMFLAWYLAALPAVWRHASEKAWPARLFPRAASIVIALLLLQSFVDYPLRTIAMASVFALACGLLVGSPPRPAGADAAAKPEAAGMRHRRRRPA